MPRETRETKRRLTLRVRFSWARLVCGALCTLAVGCGTKNSSSVSTPQTEKDFPNLAEVSESSGFKFLHRTGPPDQYSMPQIMGSGGALFDCDGDDDLDVLLIDGQPPTARGVGGTRLLRQQPAGTFQDITGESGIVQRGYGMGNAIGDIDNDGDLDLYLTAYGEDQLYRNDGQGTFVDITKGAGISNPQWGTAASFFDYDRDGWLDLFVVNYLDYFPSSICEDGRGRRDFCGPQSFMGTVDKLYRNAGLDAEKREIQFVDVTVSSGIASEGGRGLGVLTSDFNHDGLPDIFVANDMEENFLWIQQQDGTFQNQAVLRGVARNRLGEVEANMGVIFDDLNQDSYADLFVTHLTGEMNTLFSGSQHGIFQDQTAMAGLGKPSLPFTGFGVAAIDIECDGDLDLFVANGKVKRGSDVVARDPGDFWNDYAEPNQVYLNDGRGSFQDQPEFGLFTSRREVSRGLATGDIDNDGDLDLLVTNCDGPARMYRNSFPRSGNWLTVRAILPEQHRDAIGARITIRIGSKSFVREVTPSASYLCSNDPRVHFGLGNAAQYDSIEVEWPTKPVERERFPAGKADQFVVLKKNAGQPLEVNPQ